MRRLTSVILGLLLLAVLGCADAEDDCDTSRCRQFYEDGNYCTNYC